MVERNDKRRVQPFGEYMPWREFFRLFSSYVDRAGYFVPGTGAGRRRHGRRRRSGVAICWEVAFDDLVAGRRRRGAQVLAVPSNNATFGLHRDDLPADGHVTGPVRRARPAVDHRDHERGQRDDRPGRHGHARPRRSSPPRPGRSDRAARHHYAGHPAAAPYPSGSGRVGRRWRSAVGRVSGRRRRGQDATAGKDEDG